MSKNKQHTAAPKRRNSKVRDLSILLITLASIVLLNFIGSFYFDRFDLTSEKRYSLSDATITSLEELDDVVYFKIYLTGELSARYARLERNIRETLDEFRAHTDNVEYVFIDPSADADEKVRNATYQQLADMGLQYTNDLDVQGDRRTEKVIWPGAIVSYQEEEIPVNLLKSKLFSSTEELINNSIQQLEYELISAIERLRRTKRPNIGFLQGHGELSTLETASIRTRLNEFYNTESVEINGQLAALDALDALIIAKPRKPFSDKDKYIIDQFVMRGGRLLWFLEPVAASMDSLKYSKTGMTFALPLTDSLNLDEMPYKYGARVNANLIQDLKALPIQLVTGQVAGQPKMDLFPWYYSPLVTSESDHSISKNIDAISTEFACPIDTLSGKNIRKTVLLASSERSKVMTVPCPISLNLVREPPDPQQFNKPHQAIAVLLEGAFESVFTNRVPASLTSAPEIGFKQQSPADNKMLVVGDGDIIRNPVNEAKQEFFPLGYDRNTKQTFANADFIENALYYMLDDSGLIESRTKEFKIRLLNQERIDREGPVWIMINTGGPLLFVILLATCLLIIRKQVYTASDRLGSKAN